MNFVTLTLILLSVSMSAIAQILLKSGMSADSVRLGLTLGGMQTFKAVAGSPAIWMGLSVYVLSTFLWLGVLSKIDVGQAYPFVSIGFIFTMLMGIFILGEPFSLERLSGTVLIMAGVILVARSA